MSSSATGQMPPDHTDDGLRAAVILRHDLPHTGVLVLSRFLAESYAVDLVGDDAAGVGYLLKDRVGDVASSSTRSGVWRVAGRRWTRAWCPQCTAATARRIRLPDCRRARGRFSR